MANDNGILGPLVLLVSQLASGDTASEWVPAALASEALMTDRRNGEEVVSAHIYWGDVLDEWTRSP